MKEPSQQGGLQKRIDGHRYAARHVAFKRETRPTIAKRRPRPGEHDPKPEQDDAGARDDGRPLVSSIRHQEIPPAMTPSATTPVTILPVTDFRNSMAEILPELAKCGVRNCNHSNSQTPCASRG